MSPYTGMNNDPVSVVDPWGLQGKDNLESNLILVAPAPQWGTRTSKYNGPGPDREKELAASNEYFAQILTEMKKNESQAAAFGEGGAQGNTTSAWVDYFKSGGSISVGTLAWYHTPGDDDKDKGWSPSWISKLEGKLNRAMEKNWIGDLAGPESSWEGKDGFKNKGWPTMMKTWAALGTVFTGGALGFEAYGVFAANSAGTATIGAYSSLAWSTTSFTIGTYNFLSPSNKYGNKFGSMVDVIDAFRYANPFGIFNLGFRVADYTIKKGGHR